MTVQVSRFQVLLLVLQCLPPPRPSSTPLHYPPTLGEGGGGLVGEEEVMEEVMAMGTGMVQRKFNH